MTITTEEGVITVDREGVSRVALREPVPCGTCGVMHCFFVKRSPLGPSQCVECDAQDETERTLSGMEGAPLE